MHCPALLFFLLLCWKFWPLLLTLLIFENIFFLWTFGFIKLALVAKKHRNVLNIPKKIADWFFSRLFHYISLIFGCSDSEELLEWGKFCRFFSKHFSDRFKWKFLVESSKRDRICTEIIFWWTSWFYLKTDHHQYATFSAGDNFSFDLSAGTLSCCALEFEYFSCILRNFTYLFCCVVPVGSLRWIRAFKKWIKLSK